MCTTSCSEGLSRLVGQLHSGVAQGRACSTDFDCEPHLLKGLWQRLTAQGCLRSLQLGFDIPFSKQPLGEVSLQVCRGQQMQAPFSSYCCSCDCQPCKRWTLPPG